MTEDSLAGELQKVVDAAGDAVQTGIDINVHGDSAWTSAIHAVSDATLAAGVGAAAGAAYAVGADDAAASLRSTQDTLLNSADDHITNAGAEFQAAAEAPFGGGAGDGTPD